MPKRKRRSDGQSFCKSLTPRPQKIKHKVRDQDVCSENVDASIWVQCENKNCLKWRKITPKELEKVGDGSWYCSMNWDSHFNSCSAPEKKDKLPKDMKYVYSLLPKAEIVMARIPGYPLWPGLLTPDPSCGEYYDALLEKQDQPIQYHVEFLGKPHSRAWIRPKMVHPYNAITEEEKSLPFQKGSSKLLSSYQAALQEATRLMSINASERLELSCQFKYMGIDTESDKSGSKKMTESHLPAVVIKPKENKGSVMTDSYSDFDDYLSSPDEQQPNEVTQSSSCRYLTRFTKKKKNLPTRDTIEKQLEPAEKEFLNLVKDILDQKGLPPPKHPKWKGQHISLLSFYTAVQQQGGFETVCKSKLWGEIYKNLTMPDGIVGSDGNRARLFYQRHLLPYEVHMKSLQTSVTESHFVPSLGTMSPDPDRQNPLVSSEKRGRNTSTSTLGSDGEQKVPVHVMTENVESPSSSALGDHNVSPDHYAPTLDCVPSSNPDSPLAQFYGGAMSDSEDEDDDLGIDCHSAEYELQQLERFLSSIEPSLYPPQAQEGPDKRRPQETTPLNSSSLSENSPLSSGVDVLKTLNEMSRIEGTISDLDTMVSLELENL